MERYLEGEVRSLFDAWHEELIRRHTSDLTFAEIRKGVQALSSLYVGPRGRRRQPAAALEGAGKRAAFALYYAPLHFLTVYHVVREIGFDALPSRRLQDLGCGTGAAGAAWGVALQSRSGAGSGSESGRSGSGPRILGVDRSRFALDEARCTYRAFGLSGGTRRMDLSTGGGRTKDGILLAYAVNELPESARVRLLKEIGASARSERPLLVVEPVARGVAPWMSRWERALGQYALAVHAYEFRRRVRLPAWIARMDRAAGLDHGELAARVLGVIS
jgi:SAM-dependent methyltransferase